MRLAPAGDLDDWRATYVALAAHEAWHAHGDWIDAVRPQFGAAIAGRWAQARAAAAAPAAADMIDAARAGQAAVRDTVRALLGEDGVAVLPSAASVAPRLDASEDEIERVRARTFNITCVAGLAGLPQVSIPGLAPDGLPIGISLLGPAGSDRALVRLAVEVAATLDAEAGH
jgi:amidase